MNDRIPDLVSAQQRKSTDSSKNNTFPVHYSSYTDIKRENKNNSNYKENIKEITEFAEPIWKFYKSARYNLPEKDRVKNISWRIMSMQSINQQIQDSMNQNNSDNSNNTNSLMDIPMMDLEMISANSTMNHSTNLVNNNSIVNNNHNYNNHFHNNNNQMPNNDNMNTGTNNNNNSNHLNSSLKNDPLFSSFIKTPILNGLDVDGLSFSPFENENSPGNLKKLMKTPELLGITNPNINNQKKFSTNNSNNSNSNFSLDNNSLSNHLSNLRSVKKNAYDFNLQYDLDSMGFENPSVTNNNSNNFKNSSSFSGNISNNRRQSKHGNSFSSYGAVAGPSSMLENTGSFEIIGSTSSHANNSSNNTVNMGTQSSHHKITGISQPTTNINPHNMFNVNYNSKFTNSYNSRSNSNAHPSFSNEHIEFDTQIDNNELNNIKKIFEFNPISTSSALRDNSHDAVLLSSSSNIVNHNITGNSSAHHSMSDISAIPQSRNSYYSGLNLGNNHTHNNSISGSVSIASPNSSFASIATGVTGSLPTMPTFSTSSSSTSLGNSGSAGNFFDSNTSTSTSSSYPSITSITPDIIPSVTTPPTSSTSSANKQRKKATSSSASTIAKPKKAKRNSISLGSTPGMNSPNNSSKPSISSNKKTDPEPRKKRSSSSSTANPNIECSNCHTKTTPLWRKTPTGLPLCNACGLFLKLHGIVRPLSLKTDVIKKRQRLGSSKKSNTPSTSTSPGTSTNSASTSTSSNANATATTISALSASGNSASQDKKKNAISSTDSKKAEKKSKTIKKLSNSTKDMSKATKINNSKGKKSSTGATGTNFSINNNKLNRIDNIDLNADFMTDSFDIYDNNNTLLSSINESTLTSEMETLSNNIVLPNSNHSMNSINDPNNRNNNRNDNTNTNSQTGVSASRNSNTAQETSNNNNQNWEWLLKFR